MGQVHPWTPFPVSRFRVPGSQPPSVSVESWGRPLLGSVSFTTVEEASGTVMEGQGLDTPPTLPDRPSPTGNTTVQTGTVLVSLTGGRGGVS